MGIFSLYNRRERGLNNYAGLEDQIHKSIYSHLEAYSCWDSDSANGSEYGGVYNLEYSPDGTLLIAACEKKSIVLFDPITTRQTKAVKNAHSDSVNCVKFLTDCLFATCSDDTTVALWDKRNLRSKVRSLHGHMNWVKNIEYSTKENLLVTSGFDGSIFTWDINSSTEQGFVYQKVFHTPGLMRCRVSPNSNQLVICTTGGYLIIIHDLELSTLAEDLNGFKPNVYRLMQLGRQFIPTAAKFDHVFSKNMKRNRVELVSDFPNDAEVISSLQIHPHGWCALSRNISYDERTEFTCLHDIQHRDYDDSIDNAESDEHQKNNDTQPFMTTSTATTTTTTTTTTNVNSTVTHADIWAAEMTVRDRLLRVRRNHDSNTFNNTHVYGISSGVLSMQNSNATQPVRLSSPSATGGGGGGACSGYRYMYVPKKPIPQNVRRMLYSIEQPNKGQGLIKEECFSSCGRLICSPYGLGFRLLAFSPNCQELPQALTQQNGSNKLYELKNVDCHQDIVVSTRFSPIHPLLATGCLQGKIMWHQPRF
ncbi:DDB1- and CUL4-associated factor 10 homolog isoform X2 [Contarinia nasturtii]|uniref:DDB1- and CUL4-associated factor 10 homolog isoform X2 n=1 Tax=Contarinia nasturtii TaxID=265458 RepID=UPI0012D409E0|nr:DDB1- and CUL4-associated factor 10 homolog isoform X2 [Contarinia nasturtii]